MAKVVQCPANSTYGDRGVFLAGGITECPDWQAEMIQLLSASRFTLVNPRRENFDILNPNMTIEQIQWEHDELSYATAILFWFPKETLCPITLYELGKYSASAKPIFVGMHPEYKRSMDVLHQTKLERPAVTIAWSLTRLAEQVMQFERILHW
jgi:hypothetical protein